MVAQALKAEENTTTGGEIRKKCEAPVIAVLRGRGPVGPEVRLGIAGVGGGERGAEGPPYPLPLLCRALPRDQRAPATQGSHTGCLTACCGS